MAYMNQERKKSLAPGIKKVLAKYGLKGTLSVNNHSTLVLNISEGPLDVVAETKGLKEKIQIQNGKFCHHVNHYWIEENHSGKTREALLELKKVMSVGNWNKSDIQADYFNVGWYIEINLGTWKKPYKMVS